MKFIHLSDLHVGKRWGEFSLISDQKYIFDQIVDIVKDMSPDGVIIAGDIYDKSTPSAEAVEVFDDFLTKLSYLGKKIFIISGNHDSPERIAFGGKIMKSNDVFMSPVYDGNVEKITLCDEFGELGVYLLPFIKPIQVKKAFPEKAEEINSYQDAMRVVIDNLNIDTQKRNILVTHQFITGAQKCDSEDISVGGSDNIDASVFQDFDYVALGHIHGPQNITPRIRYSGTPLKYSFSELSHKKSLTVVDIGEKGDIKIDTILLKPLREVYEIRGTFDEISKKDFYQNTDFVDSYLRIVLTDEDDILNAKSMLSGIYNYILELKYDNTRTKNQAKMNGGTISAQKTPFELCMELFAYQNGREMSGAQQAYLKTLIEEIWGEENEAD